ncbi:MAG: PTS sugar transporter subunit IIC, partial [Clostridiaceae bacterium]|nr:PTS sugar transporter subunit IIC [Clostridiaceae bacterium]
LLAVLVGPPIAGFMRYLGDVVNHATRLQPFWMGIAVSAIMSFVLFSPLSSAALSIMLQLSGLAAGAATAGCCASMIGYAAASWRDNKIGGILAQALGTSMLQIGNTIRHPQILIPSTLAAVIVGPLSTLVFRMENNYMGAGMGTSGLVGQITTYATMSGSMSPVLLIVYMVLLHFLIPALISLLCYELMYRKGWIKAGYLTLPEI